MLNLLGEGAIGVMKYTGDPLVDAANVIQRNSSINEGTHTTSTVPPLQEYGNVHRSSLILVKVEKSLKYCTPPNMNELLPNLKIS